MTLTDPKGLYDLARGKKWELERVVEALNAESEHLAACVVYDVASTLLCTLRERGNINPHLVALNEFLQKEWS